MRWVTQDTKEVDDYVWFKKMLVAQRRSSIQFPLSTMHGAPGGLEPLLNDISSCWLSIFVPWSSQAGFLLSYPQAGAIFRIVV